MRLKTLPETEKAVLGCLISIGSLKDKHSLYVQKTMLLIDESCFSSPEAVIVFRALKKKFDANEYFGEVQMIEAIGQTDERAFNYLTPMIGAYFSINLLEKAVYDLVDMSVVRKQIHCVQRSLRESEQEPGATDSKNIFVAMANEIATLGNKSSQSDGESFEEIADKYLSGQYQKQRKIMTNNRLLVKKVGGFDLKSLIVIAAGPGVGKTSFATWLMYQIASSMLDRQTLFFSLEMEKIRVWEKLISVIAEKPFAELTKEELDRAISKSLELPGVIYDDSRSEIDFIETTSRLRAAEKPISVIVVDYLTVVENKGKFDANYLKQKDICVRLAALAKELDCIVIALSQVNRNAAGRPREDRCPIPSDASDSSGGHVAATLWLGLDRPEMHDSSIELKDKFVVKCRKSRFASGFFEMELIFKNGVFLEPAEHYFAAPEKPTMF